MVVTLKKKVGRSLLSKFNGKPIDPTSQATRRPPEVDIDADPRSSSDEEPDDARLLQETSSKRNLRCSSGSSESLKLEETDIGSLSKRVPTSLQTKGGSPKASSPEELRKVLPVARSGPTSNILKTGEKRKRQGGLASTEESLARDSESDDDEIFHTVSNLHKRKNQNVYGAKRNAPTANLHTLTTRTDAGEKTRQKTQFQTVPVDSTSPATNSKSSFTVPKSPLDPTKRSRQNRIFETPPQSHPSTRSSKRTFRRTSPNISPQDIGPGADGQRRTPVTEPTCDESQSQLDPSEFLNSPPASQEGSPSNIDLTRCPLCKAVVDLDFLKEHPDAKALRLQAALDFCVAHKQRSAQILWAQSKYPTIEWEKLNDRLHKFDDNLRAILERRSTSAFRQKLEEDVASGGSRNELRRPKEGSQSTRWLSGYYGAKGARMMMEYITNALASELRTSSPEDVLFTEVGVPGFIQAVLVPELVQLLVMDDFGCSREKAVEIIARSAEMGNLVNEEEEEKIQKDDDSDAYAGTERKSKNRFKVYG